MVKVEYFYSPVCPYCPPAKTLVTKVVSERDDVEYSEVNTWTEEGIKRGMSLNIMAVPAVAVENVVKLTGWPFEAKDIEACIEESKK